MSCLLLPIHSLMLPIAHLCMGLFTSLTSSVESNLTLIMIHCNFIPKLASHPLLSQQEQDYFAFPVQLGSLGLQNLVVFLYTRGLSEMPSHRGMVGSLQIHLPSVPAALCFQLSTHFRVLRAASQSLIRHDIIGTWVTEVCNNIQTEPSFSGYCYYREDESRLDIVANRLWGGQFEHTSFDVRLFNPYTPSICLQRLSAVYPEHRDLGVQFPPESGFTPLRWKASIQHLFSLNFRIASTPLIFFLEKSQKT